jgi:hypothetical protein
MIIFFSFNYIYIIEGFLISSKKKKTAEKERKEKN